MPHQKNSEQSIYNATALARLTSTEAIVLAWVSEGKRDGEIAKILHRSPRTIETHVHNILRKLGAETRTSAARMLSDHHAANGSAPPKGGSAEDNPSA